MNLNDNRFYNHLRFQSKPKPHSESVEFHREVLARVPLINLLAVEKMEVYESRLPQKNQESNKIAVKTEARVQFLDKVGRIQCR